MQDNKSESSTISTSTMRNIVDQLKMEKHRSSTKLNYYRVCKSFNRFFLRLDDKPDSWEDRLILFVGYLVQNKRKSSTIKSYVSAIKAVLQMNNENHQPINEDKFVLHTLIRACQLRNDVIQIRLPIKKVLLQLLLRSLEDILPQQPYLVILYRAMFITAYYGLFSIGEITQSPHVLKSPDVRRGTNKRKLMFILYSSKTHCRGNKPQIIKIMASDKDPHLKNKKANQEQGFDLSCPFKVINDYIAVRKHQKSTDEQFFVFRDRSPVKPHHFSHILKLCLHEMGIDNRYFAGHSFRIGRTIDLFDMGVSVESIKKIG